MTLPTVLPIAAELAPGKRRLVRALAVAMLAGVAVNVAYILTGLGGAVADTLINRWGQNLIFATAVALCVLRVRAARDGRGPWIALAVGLACYAAGNLYYSAVLYAVEEQPFPSPADVGWLSFYLPAYFGLGLIARASVRRFHPSLWLDGLVAALAVAAAGTSAVVGPILAGVHGSSAGVVVSAAYPLGDLVLLSLTLGVVALHGWRGRMLAVLAAGLVAFAAADAIHMSWTVAGTFHPGTILDSLWVVGAALMALSAWQPAQRAGSERLGSVAMLIMPLGFGLLALTVLAWGEFGTLPLGGSALAIAAVAAAMLRTALSVRELGALAETRRQAVTDDLTDLPNRRAFDQGLQDAIRRAEARGETLAVMLIDLDHFKELNDTLGHHAGDLVLEQVGPRLRSALRAEDLLARLGGDEFAMVLPDAGAAEAAGPRIAAALGERFSIDGIELHIVASVGVALYPEHGTDAETLMQRADVAMYVAKERRTGLEVYARERDRHTRDRLELIADLRTAIATGELVLHYQPKVDLRTGAISGAEALLRWPHPIRGMVPPAEFIPLAEQTGVMRPLTSFVLDEAVGQAAAWHAEGLELDIAVNISATYLLDGGLTDAVTAALDRHGLPAGRLILEITEDVIMSDPERSLIAIQALADVGVRVSLDDFGTGYSSLGYLKRLPVAELKIDRTFVRDLAVDSADQAIVQAIAALGQRLGISVIAEGVEGTDALARVTACGADGVQGFHFSPALAPEAFAAWMAERSLRAAA
jgi:diguanylate cyclase (GGDEF)-like protein